MHDTILLKRYPQNFVTWVVFVKATFSCLNRKPDDEFLLYNMPELFNKTGHGFTDIVIA